MRLAVGAGALATQWCNDDLPEWNNRRGTGLEAPADVADLLGITEAGGVVYEPATGAVTVHWPDAAYVDGTVGEVTLEVLRVGASYRVSFTPTEGDAQAAATVGTMRCGWEPIATLAVTVNGGALSGLVSGPVTDAALLWTGGALPASGSLRWTEGAERARFTTFDAEEISPGGWPGVAEDQDWSAVRTLPLAP
ncbi:MAG: hypothetical protein H6739_00605 [Alphaproteobacteria bacterium]|nr:hypothetical protein [Alphaproteobacteria bacterium]